MAILLLIFKFMCKVFFIFININNLPNKKKHEILYKQVWGY